MSKSIEKIIKKLDKLSQKHERCADSPSLAPIASVYLDTAQALRAAIEKLKTHPDNQPNEPLAPKELREMDGKPVWDTDWQVWGLVDVGLCTVVTRKGDIDLSIAAATRRLYRRPPEEFM